MSEENGSGECPPEHACGCDAVNKEGAVQRIPVNVTISDIELEQLKQELKECKDKYLRVLAESENARKRLQKERQELIQYALENLICDFLGPIDQMENAMRFTDRMSDEVKQWSIGFNMILAQFKDVLSNNGVQSFNSVGTAFDPHQHEAVEMVPTNEHPEGIVVEDNLRGYKMGDRIIRPARVKVAKAVSSESASIDNNPSENKN